MRNVHIHPTEALALGEFTMVSHDFEGSTNCIAVVPHRISHNLLLAITREKLGDHVKDVLSVVTTALTWSLHNNNEAEKIMTQNKYVRYPSSIQFVFYTIPRFNATDTMPNGAMFIACGTHRKAPSPALTLAGMLGIFVRISLSTPMTRNNGP